MKSNYRQREITFAMVDGHLVRTVTDPATGRSYEHRCTLAVFETVAHAMDEVPMEGEGTTLTEIAQREELPYTQVNVALEYLKDRGIVDVRHRRCYPASEGVHLDAMVEWYVLGELQD